MPLKSVHTLTHNLSDLSAVSEERGKEDKYFSFLFFFSFFFFCKNDFGSANLLHLHEHSIIFASAIN